MEYSTEKKSEFTVSVLTPEEAVQEFSEDEVVMAMISKLNNLRFCKAEVHTDCLCLVFSVPDKKRYQYRINFMCVVNKYSAVFIDKTGFVGSCIKKMQKNKVVQEKSLGRFIYDFLETMIEPDLRYLEEMSDRISKLENSIASGIFEKFDNKMFSIRKEILVFYRYYSQFMDIGQELQENENEFFDHGDTSFFRLFTDRTRQLHEETKMLREYTLQLREVYQTQFDIKQNKIMKVLTVVTTIFSPLTIIVGWYGMNFTNMNELTWDYGYAYVILMSIIAIFCSIWVLKKKKFM